MDGLDSSDASHIIDPDSRLSPNELHAITSHLAGQEDFWRPHTVNAPATRLRTRVLWSPQVEIWLVGWGPDHSMEPHDHGGASGAFTVCQGAIDTHERSLDDPNDPVRQRTLRVGDSVTFDADHVHEIVNRSGEPATTIHAYSPALTTMTFYAPVVEELIPTRRAEVSDPDSNVIATPVGAGRG